MKKLLAVAVAMAVSAPVSSETPPCQYDVRHLSLID